jgi:hypothetical protein
LQLLDGALVILLGPLDQRQGQSVSGRGSFLVAAELLQELAEAVARKALVMVALSL